MNISDLPFFKNKKVEVQQATQLSSFNRTFTVIADGNSYFVKTNDTSSQKDFFEKEVFGLAHLEQLALFKIPKVWELGKTKEDVLYLVLEFLDTQSADDTQWGEVGKRLAEMHRFSHSQFGWEHSNYIGALTQNNTFHTDFSEFFINERIEPQVKLAYDEGRIETAMRKSFDRFYLQVPMLFPKEKPSLIHGDLWSGNVLFTKHSLVTLIDPALSYAHREMDMAMTQLFGSFPATFYESYQDVFPLEKGFSHRQTYYQLYYLLVHLNLFGTSYYRSVKNIIQKF